MHTLPMFGFIIALALLPEPPKDLQPPLAQTPQGTGVAVALLPFLLVINLGPWTGPATSVDPEVNGQAQRFVTGVTHVTFAKLAALVAHRTDSGLTEQALYLRIFFADTAQLGRQA